MRDKQLEDAFEAFVMFIMILILAGALILFCKNVYAAPVDYLKKCAPYKEYVQGELRENGLNPDYYYLMVAESHCRHGASSTKGAQGFWQLMPYISKKYGCENPHDLPCATNAAIGYLKRLETRFKRFEHVIYAYNMGGGNFAKFGATKQAKGLLWSVEMLRDYDSM